MKEHRQDERTEFIALVSSMTDEEFREAVYLSCRAMCEKYNVPFDELCIVLKKEDAVHE